MTHRTDRAQRPLAVFDLDNTLASTAHRQHFLERRPRDWDGFFAAAPEDPPLAEGIALVRESAETCDIVYLTEQARALPPRHPGLAGRTGAARGELHMRGNADRRPARITKLAVLRRLARTREVRMLVDDDELVCEDARRAGFTVVHARWATPSDELKDAQEREGRT